MPWLIAQNFTSPISALLFCLQVTPEWYSDKSRRSLQERFQPTKLLARFAIKQLTIFLTVHTITDYYSHIVHRNANKYVKGTPYPCSVDQIIFLIAVVNLPHDKQWRKTFIPTATTDNQSYDDKNTMKIKIKHI